MRIGLGVLLLAMTVAVGCTITTNTVLPKEDSALDTSGTPKPGTQIPVIRSLTASPTSISQPGQSISIQIDAYDPSGGNLRYTWSATGGVLASTSGTLITWKSPSSAGTYTVTVLVANDGGGSVVGSLNINVSADGSGTISEPVISPGDSPGGDTGSSANLAWAQVSPGISYKDCYFVSFSSGWAVGSGGKVRHTTDAGRTWVKQDLGDTSAGEAVYFLSPNMGWVGGYKSLYKTGDAGAHWSKVALSDEAGTVTGIHFTDASNGAVTYQDSGSGGILVTSDGGANWTSVARGRYYIRDGSSNGTIFFGGFANPSQLSPWVPAARYEAGGLTDVFEESFGFMSHAPLEAANRLATHYAELFRSTDDGQSWDEVEYEVNQSAVNGSRYAWHGLGMLSASEGLGVLRYGDEQFAIVDTANSGSRWSVLKTLTMSISNKWETSPRFFAFDRRHAWQAFADDSKLLRIGSY